MSQSTLGATVPLKTIAVEVGLCSQMASYQAIFPCIRDCFKDAQGTQLRAKICNEILLGL